MASIIGATRMIKYLRKPASQNRNHAAYIARKMAVKAIGFASYKEYLASEEWKAIRARVLSRHPKCRGCQGRATQVHHLAYVAVVLLGLRDILLASICKACHEHIEYDGEDKCTLKRANAKLFMLARQSGSQAWVENAFFILKKLIDPEVALRRIERHNSEDKGTKKHRHIKQRIDNMAVDGK